MFFQVGQLNVALSASFRTGKLTLVCQVDVPVGDKVLSVDVNYWPQAPKPFVASVKLLEVPENA